MASAVCQNQFLGSRISLVSKSEIRYEGILYALDLCEATISLAKVRSFGTEDRPTDRPIPAKDDVYEYIVFRGTDIKAIDVVEPPKHASNSGTNGIPSDPAIVDFSHSGSGHFGQPFDNQGGRMRPSNNESSRSNVPMYGGGGGGGGHPRRNANGGGMYHQNEAGVQAGRGNLNRNNSNNMGNNGVRQQFGRNNFGGYGMNYRQGGGYIRDNNGGQFQQRGRTTTPNRGGNYGQPRSGTRQQGQGNRGTPFRNRGMNQAAFPPKVAFDGDYDFEKANEELLTTLAKAKLEDETAENKDEPTPNGPDEQENKEPRAFYKKDDFFDNISCEALERSKGNVPRVDWKAERKLNAETFGLTLNNGNNQQFLNTRINNQRSMGGQRMPHRGGNGMMMRNSPGGGNWMNNSHPGNFFRGNRRPRMTNN